jgi:hypothetical protein
MLKELNRLVASEVELMVKAPLLVCILIAGADNEIDNKEIHGAIKMAKRRKEKGKDTLSKFYDMVAEDFEDKLKIILQGFPSQSAQRNPLLLEELGRLNTIFPKLDNSFASDYYKSLLYIARKTAESSGGMLGLNKVGDEEDKFLKLPMIKDPSSLR